MQCVGYWKENLKSYLITYDQLDAFTKYRCWVYQRLAMQEFDPDIHVVSPNTQGLTWTRCWCRCQSDLSVTSIKMLTARIGNKVLLFHLNWMRMKESVSCFKGRFRWFVLTFSAQSTDARCISMMGRILGLWRRTTLKSLTLPIKTVSANQLYLLLQWYSLLWH